MRHWNTACGGINLTNRPAVHSDSRREVFRRSIGHGEPCFQRFHHRCKSLHCAAELTLCLTALFNERFRSELFPYYWQDATLRVIPKSQDDPSGEITKKSFCYRLLSYLLTGKLNVFLENVSAMPNNTDSGGKWHTRPCLPISSEP